jgi:uncharacterized protein
MLPSNKLTNQVLEQLFGEANLGHDLKDGTITGIVERVLYINADLISGVQQGLIDEIGEAWREVLATCGHFWGKRVATSIEKYLQVTVHVGVEQLLVGEYLSLVEEYFACHGWGRAKIHLDDAKQHGIVRVSLQNSIFAIALKHVEGPVDQMVAGMLRGMFERVASRPLDCLQVAWENNGDDEPVSEFLVSSPKRIEVLKALVTHSIGVNNAIAQLRAA